MVRTSKKLEDLDPRLRGPIKTQEFFQALEEPAQPCPPPETAEIDPKMHETAKIILKPPDMRLDSGALMGSKLHIERVQSFSLRHSDKKPENSFL